MGPEALLLLAALRAGSLAPPPGTVRAFTHICEEAHLLEIARAHPLPGAPARPRPVRAKKKDKGKPPAPVALCVLGDYGFSRASVYLQLEAGQRVWLYDAATADQLAGSPPAATLELDARGRLVVTCAGCDGQPAPLQASDDGVVGALWVDLGGGRLHVREHGSRRELALPAGIPIRGRLYVATPSAEAACGECDLMALSIFLPPAEARAFRALKPRP
jgi:hypothetical protein